MESCQGNVFGGFTSAPIKSESQSVPVRDSKAWLFSLTHASIHRLKPNKRGSLQNNENYFMIFGEEGNEDLYIYDNCDKNTNSQSKLGNTFALPEGTN